MRKILIILLLIPFKLSAQNWYVDNTGTGDTLSTIAEVNALGSSSDDTIFFKKGCIWRETLTIPGSGTAGHYVVYSTYGTGAKPKIYGSNKAITWTAEGHTNIWQSATSVIDPFAIPGYDDAEVFFEETGGDVSWGDNEIYSADFANLTAEYDWTWNANVLYVYAASDPDSRYTSVEAPQRGSIIDINSRDYLEINGLDLRYSVYGIGGGTAGTGLTIRNTNISYLGEVCADCPGYGTGVLYNDMLFDHDTVHDCGRRGLSMANYTASDISGITVQYCAFYNGYHTTGVDISTGANAGNNGDINNITIKNNYFYEASTKPNSSIPTNFIWLQGPRSGTGQVLNVNVYNNIFMHTYTWAVAMEDVDTSYIYNNTFYETNRQVTAGNIFFIYSSDNSTQGHIKNNLFYTTDTRSNYEGVAMSAYTDYDVDYNSYYRTNNNAPIVMAGGAEYHIDDQATLISQRGWETNGIFTDPDFINITDPMEVDSLMIDALSPAKDAGIGLGMYTTYDYRDSLRDENPDIGAYEYGASSPDIPPDPPTISTNSVNIIYTRLARCGGNITDDGGGAISDRGICWSTSVNPTVTGSHIHIGTGDGAFSGYLEGLSANTTYYVRSFCYNESSEDPYYGGNETFTTPVHSTARNGGKILRYNNKSILIK